MAKKTIPANIPEKFTIVHTQPETPHAIFDFLRWELGLDFDMNKKEQGYGGYKTTFKFKEPFQKKD